MSRPPLSAWIRTLLRNKVLLMRIGGIEVKRRVWITLLFALAVIVLWWLWTGSKLPAVAVQETPEQPSVRLARKEVGGGDQVLRDRAEYFDPTPLFFPTEWNFGQGALRESMKRQPGQIFGLVEPQFVFEDQKIKPDSSDTTMISENLADVVAAGNETPFGGMGEMDIQRVMLSARDGFMEIRSLRDGKTIIAQTLTGVPFTETDFVPLEFLVVVSSAGLVADPVLMSGSGREEMEVFLRTYLAKSFRVGERLAPGMYRILVGP